MTELLAIMLSQRFIVDAADELRDDLPRVDSVEITVGERSWTCLFECGDAAKTTRPALHAQAEEQARKICAHIQKEADRRQGRLRWLRSWGCPSGLVAAAGLAGAAFIPGDPRELIVGAFVVAVPSIFGLNRLPKLVRHAASETERDKRAVTEQINQAADQLADLWDADRRRARDTPAGAAPLPARPDQGQRQRGHPPGAGGPAAEDARFPCLDAEPASAAVPDRAR